MIHYEIVKAHPEQLHLQVRYYKDGKPDYWANYKVTDFSSESLHKVAVDGAPAASRFWTAIEGQPESVVLEDISGTAKEIVHEEAPAIIEQTHIIEATVTETDDVITHGWIVREKTAEELARDISAWRKFTAVTPRQARLELAKRGQLANIDTIIASLPAEQQEVVQTEWEYAVSIHRSSPWVVQLGAKLGLDEVGLDELFKSASEL